VAPRQGLGPGIVGVVGDFRAGMIVMDYESRTSAMPSNYSDSSEPRSPDDSLRVGQDAGTATLI
jgi:hypothetical protein